MKVAVELLGRVLCIELSALLFSAQEPPGTERVTVGTMETEIADGMAQPFGFTYTRKSKV